MSSVIEQPNRGDGDLVEHLPPLAGRASISFQDSPDGGYNNKNQDNKMHHMTSRHYDKAHYHLQ